MTASAVVNGGSQYEERRPQPGLESHVSSVWFQHLSVGRCPYAHRNVPNGSVELMCRIGSAPQIIGPLTRGVVELLAPGSTVVGLRVRPGAAPSVLGISPSELVDLVVDADTVWGRSMLALGERVAISPSPEAGMALLEQFIIDRLGDGAGPDPLVAEAVRRLMPWGAQDAIPTWPARSRG